MFDFSFVPPNSSILTMFGIASAVLSVLAYFPYIVDIFRGQTQPARACWLIWSVLGSISFFSQVYEGATHSLLFAGAQVGGTIFICLLSLYFGAGHSFSRKSKVFLLLAALGLVAWYITDNAVYALAIAIGISLMGGMLTIAKAYLQPETETLSTWLVALTASSLGILSVGQNDWVLLAYPVYLFILYSAIVIAMIIGNLRARPMVANGRLVTTV